ncbi:hypothetical protein C8A03DRAFT_14322 [Achaetomium macrosporum]|uniref:Zinc finger PHD-type domain-containing protein n=1 Tax=Achaetomium macrosporum TaxID=79813 RepID=A0AAN7CCY6_9PEZI|nr:hypothetical protein C8A03DRAFT_14322 [Achaetomium macrosporum]
MTALNHRNRRLPFLHRNWLKATNHWNSKMGGKVSSLYRNGGDGHADDDHHSERPAKRRRVNSDYDGFPLFENYGNTQRALRIEVLKISHKDAPRVKNGILNGVVAPNIRDVVQVRARCKLTICGHKGGEPVVLHVDSQVCDIRIFKNPPGSPHMARFSSIRPFHIPEEKIFLERDDDAVFGLADCYSVLVELESAGDAHWPPTDLVPMSDEDMFYYRGLPPRQWVLTACIADVFSTRNRKSVRLRVKKQPHNPDVATDFLMDMDVRWLTAVSRDRKQREHHAKDILPSISVFSRNEPAAQLVNGNHKYTNVVDVVLGTNGHLEPQMNGMIGETETTLNGQTNGLTADAVEELAEGELTPGRSRRARQDINYNVKQMWNNAVGRETRKRRKLGDEQSPSDEQTITYLLPPEQVHTDKFTCLLCGAENDRLSQLRAHYLSHPQYDLHFELRPRAGYCVTVKPNANSRGSPMRPKVYQLGLPVKPLDLEKYVNGDDSWVTSRLGPENGREIFQERTARAARSKLITRRARKKVLVPKTKQPLFDPLSKVQLQPGVPVPQHPIDDSWLLLKHRDNLQDFIDLNSEEKEYLQEWDAFILRKHISSEQYLPRNFLRFVREKASWIVTKQSRADEFSKHVSILLARRVLPDTAIFEATKLLNDARSRQAAHGADEEPAQPPRNKATGGCCTACGEPVPAPEMLICADKQCKNRLYHDSCVGDVEETVAKGANWKCKACSSRHGHRHSIE